MPHGPYKRVRGRSPGRPADVIDHELINAYGEALENTSSSAEVTTEIATTVPPLVTDALATDPVVQAAVTTAVDAEVPGAVDAEIAAHNLASVAGDGDAATAARTDHNHANTALTGAMHIGPAVSALPAPTVFLAADGSRDAVGTVTPVVGAAISTAIDATFGTYWTHPNTTAGNVNTSGTGRLFNAAGTIIVDALFLANTSGGTGGTGGSQWIAQSVAGAGNLVRIGRFAGTGSAPAVTIGNLTLQGSGSVADNVWTTLAVTWDGAEVTLYRDGAVVAGPAAYTGTVPESTAIVLIPSFYAAVAHAIFHAEALDADSIARISALSTDKTWDSVQDGTAASLADGSTAMGAGAVALAANSVAIGKGAVASEVGQFAIAADIIDPLPVSGGGTGVRLRSPDGTPFLFGPDNSGAWPGTSAVIRTADTVLLGDSITGSIAAGQGYNDATRRGTWDKIASGGQMRVIHNAGVPGDRSDQMLARIDADVIAHDPDYCVLMAGTNDAAQSVTLASYQTTMQDIVSALRGASIQPLICAVIPRAASAALVSAYNAWLSQWCAREGIPFADTYTPLVDAATGGILAAYDADGTHLNQAGLALASETLWAAFARYYPAAFLSLATSAGDASNLVTNGLFLTDSNTDGTPDDWTTSGTIAPSIVSGTPGMVGNWLQLDPTGTGTRFIYQSVASGFAVGDRLLLAGRADIEDTGGGAQWTIYLQFRDAGNVAIGLNANVFRRIEIAYPTGSGSFVFGVEEVVPTGAVTARALIQVETGTGAAKFGQMTLRNLTTMGLDT